MLAIRRFRLHTGRCRDRFSFRQPHESGPGSDQHRQDASRHRAAVRPFKRRDRLPAAIAGARGLRPGARGQGRQVGGADHRRGADRAGGRALLPLHGRSHAPRRWRAGLRRARRGAAFGRSRARAYLHRPTAPRAGARRDDAARRGHARADGEGAVAQGRGRAAAALLDPDPFRRAQAVPPAAASRIVTQPARSS